jgi:hypothetical protein
MAEPEHQTNGHPQDGRTDGVGMYLSSGDPRSVLPPMSEGTESPDPVEARREPTGDPEG